MLLQVVSVGFRMSSLNAGTPGLVFMWLKTFRLGSIPLVYEAIALRDIAF